MSIDGQGNQRPSPFYNYTPRIQRLIIILLLSPQRKHTPFFKFNSNGCFHFLQTGQACAVGLHSSLEFVIPALGHQFLGN